MKGILLISSGIGSPVARDFKLEKCKDKGAYSAKLAKPAKLNLQAIAGKFRVIEDTPILLLIEAGGFEIIVHVYGELMFKNSGDMEKMRKAAEEIYAEGLK